MGFAYFDKDGKLVEQSFDEALAEHEAHRRELRKGIVHNKRLNAIILTWGNYPYEIGLERICTPLHLLDWVLHLSGKNWMDSEKMRLFILTVIAAKKWKRPCA